MQNNRKSSMCVCVCVLVEGQCCIMFHPALAPSCSTMCIALEMKLHSLTVT